MVNRLHVVVTASLTILVGGLLFRGHDFSSGSPSNTDYIQPEGITTTMQPISAPAPASPVENLKDNSWNLPPVVFPTNGRNPLDIHSRAIVNLPAFRHTRDRMAERQKIALLQCKNPSSLDTVDTGGWCLAADASRPMLAAGRPMALEHVVADDGIAALMARLFFNSTVGEIGAGIGQYGVWYAEHGSMFLQYDAFDGAPNVVEFTLGAVNYVDVTLVGALNGLCYDFVSCLEVGEHIPGDFTDVLIDNIVSVAKRGVALSWAVPGQSGHSHINCLSNEDIIQRMTTRGFTYQSEISEEGRKACTHKWFQGTFMYFLRNSPLLGCFAQ